MTSPIDRMGGPLRVPVMGQPTSTSCGITSLRAVLLYHGKDVSLRKLRRLCGSTREGTDHRGIVSGALALGARVFAKADGTLTQLHWFAERGLPSIVGWWSNEPGDPPFDPTKSLADRREHDCGHFSVCRGFNETSVLLMDPQWRKARGVERVVGNRAMLRRRFLGVWYDTDTSRYVLVRRWYAVVHFYDRTFADQIGGGMDYGAPHDLDQG